MLLAPRPLLLAALALLGLVAGCDRTLDPEEARSLALGQNLYRAGRLQWWAPAALVPQLERQQARWSRVVGGVPADGSTADGSTAGGLTVEGPTQGEGDAHAARLLVCGPEDPAAALLAEHGLRWSDGQLVAGPWSAPAAECAVVATLLDPARHRLPLTLAVGATASRQAEGARALLPGWRREVVVLRGGEAWLWLDLEGGAEEFVALRRLAEESWVEHESAGEPWARLLAAPSVPGERVRAFAAAADAAARRAGLDPGTGWSLRAAGAVEPGEVHGIREATEGVVDPIARTARWCVADGRVDRFARAFVARLLELQRPEAPAWWIDARASWAAGWAQGPRYDRAASHPARPSAAALLDDSAGERHSELLLGPLRARLLEASTAAGATPEAYADTFLAGLPEPATGPTPDRPRPAPASSVLLSARDGLGGAASQALLERLAAEGVGAVGLAFDLSLDGTTGFGRAFAPERRLRALGGDAAVRAAGAQARALGLEVQLWPTVLSSRTGGPVGREVRVFDEQRVQLFDELEAALTHAALLAEEIGASWCSLGHRVGETASTRVDLLEEADAFGRAAREARAAGWQRVLRAVRAGFAGGVVLTVPEPARLEHVGFLGDLDAAGCNLFPVLEGLDQGQVRSARLLPLMRERLAPAQRTAAAAGVPLWVAPLGVRAREGAGRGPGLESGAPDPGRRLELLEAAAAAVRERGATVSLWKVAPAADSHFGLGTPEELRAAAAMLAP